MTKKTVNKNKNEKITLNKKQQSISNIKKKE